jgi:hypothetical protein
MKICRWIDRNLAGATGNDGITGSIHQLHRPMNCPLYRLAAMKKRRHDDAAAL